MKKIIIYFFLVIAIFSCKKERENDDSQISSIVVLNANSEDYQAAISGSISDYYDTFTLNEIRLKNDSVFISVSYGGGCRQHQFEIIWGEELLCTVPPSISMIIKHNANGDPCEAYITETIAFSLEDLTGSISADTVCVNIINGITLTDSLSAGGWDPGDTIPVDDDDYNVVFLQGTECVVEVTASRVICGAGLYNNLWFALNDSVSAGLSDFYFHKYLQPVAIAGSLTGFVPVEGKKYKIGATVLNEHPYNQSIVCLAYSGPSVPVKIHCITELN